MLVVPKGFVIFTLDLEVSNFTMIIFGKLSTSEAGFIINDAVFIKFFFKIEKQSSHLWNISGFQATGK